jgi:hypothetical protein
VGISVGIARGEPMSRIVMAFIIGVAVGVAGTMIYFDRPAKKVVSVNGGQTSIQAGGGDEKLGYGNGNTTGLPRRHAEDGWNNVRSWRTAEH